MTLGALNRIVNSAQGEILMKIASDFPIAFGMTFNATSPEAAPVRIFMAIHALRVERLVFRDLNFLLLPENELVGRRLVAFDAVEVTMPSPQNKLRLLIVVEPGLGPFFHAMAFGTIRPQLTFVVVCMTGQAVLLLDFRHNEHAQVQTATVRKLLSLQIRRSEGQPLTRFLMAFDAF